jgi:hypothetical protein
MIGVHFAPGLFAHVPALDPVSAPVLWFGRTATPAFVTVFGLTVGFALMPRYRRGAEGQTARRLRARAGAVLAAAAVVSLPGQVRLVWSNSADAWQWLFGWYSVLLFYSLALALLPVWLRLLRRHTGPRAGAAGLALWAAGTIGYYVWPQGPLSVPEFVRLVLLSGGYGYCQMMGTALLAVPVGLWLRQTLEAGDGGRALPSAFAAGLALSAIGAAWGMAAGEYDLARIAAGDLRIPARGWYFLHFGALALAAAAGLELLNRGARWFRPVGYPLALFGQVALVLYTGHVFVLPAVQLAHHLTPLHGVWRVAAGFVPFVGFCALLLYSRHRRVTSAVRRDPGRSPSLDPTAGAREELPGGPNALWVSWETSVSGDAGLPDPGPSTRR